MKFKQHILGELGTVLEFYFVLLVLAMIAKSMLTTCLVMSQETHCRLRELQYGTYPTIHTLKI